MRAEQWVWLGDVMSITQVSLGIQDAEATALDVYSGGCVQSEDKRSKETLEHQHLKTDEKSQAKRTKEKETDKENEQGKGKEKETEREKSSFLITFVC